MSAQDSYAAIDTSEPRELKALAAVLVGAVPGLKIGHDQLAGYIARGLAKHGVRLVVDAPAAVPIDERPGVRRRAPEDDPLAYEIAQLAQRLDFDGALVIAFDGAGGMSGCACGRGEFVVEIEGLLKKLLAAIVDGKFARPAKTN